MTTTYTVIQGMLVHENREGVETFYVPDTQGSLMECRSASGVKTYEAEYWPYGEVRTSTGSNPSPWNFVGLLGYFRDLPKLLYVRARHYRPDLARWQTVDPLWPSESAYGYVDGRPVDRIDPSGSLPAIPLLCASACVLTAGCIAGVWIACGKLWGEPEFIDCVLDYIGTLPLHSQIGCLVGVLGCLACIYRGLKGCAKPVCPPSVKDALDNMVIRICKHGGKRGCDERNDNCDVLRARVANIVGCIGARLAVMFACYKGGNDGHWVQVEQERTMLMKCADALRAKRCKPFGPN